MTEDESKEDDSQNQYENTNDGTVSEWINKMTSGNVWSTSKQVKCQMKIGEQPVNFQIDTGSSVNIFPVKFVRNFKETETMLKTLKNEDYNPLGETRVVIRNPKNKKNYNVNFIICHNGFTTIFGLRWG